MYIYMQSNCVSQASGNLPMQVLSGRKFLYTDSKAQITEPSKKDDAEAL